MSVCLVIHNLNYILALTGGIDSIIKQKKEELEDIKVDSYFQKKSSEVTEDGETTEKPKKKAKKWVDLDKEGFDDIEGSVHSEEDDEAEGEEDPELGMISHKKSLITIFGHKHKIKNFIKNF